MNGLKQIRINCNISQGDLADQLGVTRQMINMWENGRKAILDKRKDQLSDIFGIEREYLEEIEDARLAELENKAMYRFLEDGKETYRYSPGEGDTEEFYYCMKNRKERIDEMLLEKLKEKESLLKRVDAVMTLPEKRYSILSRYARIGMGVEAFSRLLEAMEKAFSKKEKINDFFVITDLLNALNMAIDKDFDIEVTDADDEDRVKWKIEMAKLINDRITSKTKKPKTGVANE